MQYPVNCNIPARLIEDIIWLEKRDLFDKYDHNLLLDVLHKDGKELFTKRLSKHAWTRDELTNLINKWIVTSKGEMFQVLNVIPNADPTSGMTVMLIDNDPQAAYIFNQYGLCSELLIFTVFDEMPESTSDRLLREQRDHASVDATVTRKRYNDIQRSTALPQAMAAPYENELQPKLTTFDDDPHANTYPDLGRDLQRMAEQDDEDDDE